MKEMIPLGTYTVLAEAPGWVWVLGGVIVVIIIVMGIIGLAVVLHPGTTDPNNEKPRDKELPFHEPKRWWGKLINCFAPMTFLFLVLIYYAVRIWLSGDTSGQH